MKLLPRALSLPIAQTTPACHTAAKTQRLGQVFPGDPGSQDKQNAVEDGMVIKAWTATSRRSVSGGQEGLQGLPELRADDFSCHAVYVGIGIIRINSVLLAALRRPDVTPPHVTIRFICIDSIPC